MLTTELDLEMTEMTSQWAQVREKLTEVLPEMGAEAEKEEGNAKDALRRVVQSLVDLVNDERRRVRVPYEEKRRKKAKKDREVTVFDMFQASPADPSP